MRSNNLPINLIFKFYFKEIPNKYNFLPKAYTCINLMVLHIGSLTSEFPNEEQLFEVFDCALQMPIFVSV